MNVPESVTSLCAFVWLRQDLTREDARGYWRHGHSQIANKVPSMLEYLQHHFSQTDRGFWPVPKGVGGIIPADWVIDGATEIRIKGILHGLIDRFFRVKAVFNDEFNAFDRVLANATPSRGGRWWTGSHRKDIGYRAMILFRAHNLQKGAPFRDFLYDTMSPALIKAGASELRSYVFQPGSRFSHLTPDVRHDQPANRAYSGAITIGAKSRKDLDQILNSAIVKATQDAQKKFCISIHAYGIENTYPCVLEGKPQAATWD